jgi:hypothetical protein
VFYATFVIASVRTMLKGLEAMGHGLWAWR